MIDNKDITEPQARQAMEQEEFGIDVISSKDRVVVLMTQDWCPQWQEMKRWIYEVGEGTEFDLYVLIYNQTPYFSEFLKFKETVWKNDRIPYLRYYHNGKLIKETNYVSRNEFLKIIG